LDIRVVSGLLSLDHIEVPDPFVKLGDNFLDLLMIHPSEACASHHPCIG